MANLPTAEAFLPIVNLERNILVGTVFIVVVSGFLIGWATRYHIRPLLIAARIIRSVTRSGKIMRPLKRIKHDEIGYVTLAFNQLLVNMQKKEQEIRELAMYDSLTKLPKRRLLFDRLSVVLNVRNGNGHHAAILFLDLDKFKHLNDTHGHGAGDALLLEMAERLKTCVRKSDTVSRFGGDEFIVLLTELAAERDTALKQVTASAEKIRAMLAANYVLKYEEENQNSEGIPFESSASIGACIFKSDEASADELIKRADEAMYLSKKAGRNAVCVYGMPNYLDINT